MPTEGMIRAAALDMILRVGADLPSPEAIAERTGLPAEVVQETLPTDEDSLYGYLIQPFAEAMDEELKRLPLHSTPSLSEQRQILDAILNAALAKPTEVHLQLRMLSDRREHVHYSRRVDSLAYQAGVRLLGTEYDEDPDQMSRIHFVAEALSMAVVSRRHDLHDPHQRTILIDSLLGMLHPPVCSSAGVNAQRRRWTDPSAESAPVEVS